MVTFMKTIKNNFSSTIIVEKSTFITELIKLNDVSLVKEELLKIREKYKDATHYCYAYIIDENKKSSDDGEPGGTAGVPMMEVLNKFELNYILCIVIRYFGGIKLGAGGLVRTYRKSVAEALKKVDIIELIDGYNLTIEVAYNRQNELEHLLTKNYSKKYQEKVIYEALCSEEEREILKEKFNITKEEKRKIEI